MSKASEYQPDPVSGKRIVVEGVVSDILERAEEGKKKYGTYLMTDNGREAMWDAYQEALDLVMYLKQHLMENEAVRDKNDMLDELVETGFLRITGYDELQTFIGYKLNGVESFYWLKRFAKQNKLHLLVRDDDFGVVLTSWMLTGELL